MIQSTAFPSVDPIPLPAPVWLFKVLHELTLALHFTAMLLLLGGLLIGTAWAISGRLPGGGMRAEASRLIARRLPVLMAYVINFGIPPLLFAQVLYGRALYTSSVLIGALWIAVVPLLMGCYWALYAGGRRAAAGAPWTRYGVLALALAVMVAFVYANNMTLMLRPEAWSDMYQASPGGWQRNAGDSTVMPRLTLVVGGAFLLTGAGLLLLARSRQSSDALATFLRRAGARLTTAAGIVVAALGIWAFWRHPEAVRADVLAHPLFGITPWAWLACASVVIAIGIWNLWQHEGRGPPVAAAVAAFLLVAVTVLVRSGIRDLTLLRKGFDVWQRTVVTNWVVVGLFLVLFVAALGVVTWMARVVATARSPEESHA